MKKQFSIALAIIMCAGLLVAGPDEDRGLEIAQEVDKRDTGFIDQVVDMEMVLRNRQGQQSVRQVTLKTLEVAGDGDKALSVFQSPRDVKGTALLSFTHKSGPDDQWLYLPALKRVKRISSTNRSGPFMGSEFAYEDISSQEVEKYTYKFIKEGTLDGLEQFMIERYPVDKNSGYSKQEVYIDKAHYRVQKVVYYDRKGQLLKTQQAYEYKPYPVDQPDGSRRLIWRFDRVDMVNHQTGRSTTLNWDNYTFNNGLKDQDFNTNALKRQR